MIPSEKLSWKNKITISLTSRKKKRINHRKRILFQGLFEELEEMFHFLDFWEVIEEFKNLCTTKGWITFEHEDLVKAGDKYHYLVFTHRIFPETFRRVILNSRQCIREGNMCRTVDVSHIAWISQNAIPDSVLTLLVAKPMLLRKVALYDISPLSRRKNLCLKINETESPVFLEFEKFLIKHGLSIKPLGKLPSLIC